MVAVDRDILVVFILLLIATSIIKVESLSRGFNPVNPRLFVTPNSPGGVNEKPKLILISGAPGTGKSTFGMTIALDQKILKCISTDTIRAVMRSFVGKDISPALHRSSYAPSSTESIDDGDGVNDNSKNDDPVRSWKESCMVLDASIKELVDDAIRRHVSLVVEGVHVVPSKELITKWEQAGGIATGCLLIIPNEDAHKNQLMRRGYMTGNIRQEEMKINSFHRIRAIQDEMIKRAKESNWLLIEQRLEPDPLEIIANKLNGDNTDCIISTENVPSSSLKDNNNNVLKHEKNEKDLSSKDDDIITLNRDDHNKDEQNNKKKKKKKHHIIEKSSNGSSMPDEIITREMSSFD